MEIFLHTFDNKILEQVPNIFCSELDYYFQLIDKRLCHSIVSKKKQKF